MPPSSPFGRRRRSSTLPSRSVSQKCTPCRSGRARFAALRGNSAAMPARRPAQSAIHGHSAQAGAAGVQTVAPRSNSAWAKSDGRARAAGSSPSRAARRRNSGFAFGSSSLDREQPRHHALDIAVHRHRRHAEGDRADRGGGVVADARQRAQPGQIARKPARRRPRPGRRRAGCAHARSSQAPPRRRARPPAARRPAPRWWGSALRIFHSKVSSPQRWSAAA